MSVSEDVDRALTFGGFFFHLTVFQNKLIINFTKEVVGVVSRKARTSLSQIPVITNITKTIDAGAKHDKK